jgi:bacteriorhodopsin
MSKLRISFFASLWLGAMYFGGILLGIGLNEIEPESSGLSFGLLAVLISVGFIVVATRVLLGEVFNEIKRMRK